MLRAAFIPFGDIIEVHIPKDHVKRARRRARVPAGAMCGMHDLNIRAESNRGFGFVEFEEEDDAAAAVDNMNGAAARGGRRCPFQHAVCAAGRF